jgi:hypothetical protein
MKEISKAEIAKKHFGVKYGTMWTWYKKGVPAEKIDAAYSVITKRARAQGSMIQGSAFSIKNRLRTGPGFVQGLKMAFPGVW